MACDTSDSPQTQITDTLTTAFQLKERHRHMQDLFFNRAQNHEAIDSISRQYTYTGIYKAGDCPDCVEILLRVLCDSTINRQAAVFTFEDPVWQQQQSYYEQLTPCTIHILPRSHPLYDMLHSIDTPLILQSRSGKLSRIIFIQKDYPLKEEHWIEILQNPKIP
jgi:hypothetical protein